MATLEDMMDDLGLARAEEVASDGRNHRRFPQDAIAKATPTLPQDDGSNMWQNAVRNGHFEDDDFNSVKLLDPLSNGNLHRQNRQVRDVIGELLEGDPRYDPTQPGYRGGRRRRPEAVLPPDHHISKNGILLPPGMVTKRWEPTTRPGAKSVAPAQLPSVNTKPAPKVENRKSQLHHITASEKPSDAVAQQKAIQVAHQTPASIPNRPVPDQSPSLKADNASVSIADKDRRREMLNVPRIEAVVTDQNLRLPEAQECIQLVRGIEAAEFAEMTAKAQQIEVYLRHYYGPSVEGIPILKCAAAQISLMRLISRQSFEELPDGEKWRALALVYKGVLLTCQMC